MQSTENNEQKPPQGEHVPYPGTENEVDFLQGVSCCPHCGQSEEGYYYGVVMRYRQYKGFTNHPDEDLSSVEEATSAKSTQFRCVTCNKIIKSVWPKVGV